jgi:hypothetical protein
VPSYRVVSGYGIALDRFDAAGDEDAWALARKRAGCYASLASPVWGRRTDLSVERLDGDRWRFVAAWVPRRRSPLAAADRVDDEAST